MAAYRLLDFSDIYTAIAEELKVQISDTTTLNRIKRMVNMIYLDEVVPASRWWWLYGTTAVTHPNYYTGGTASVTPNMSTVTLSVAPAVTDGEGGSLKNWFFAVDGKNEIYRITAHTALSQTITLDRPYNQTLDATATFKCWTDTVALPTDCRETIEMWHDHIRTSMEARGLQDFRKIVAADPRAENRPFYYSTYDFDDPTPDDDETESDRRRTIKVHPSISQYKTLIKVDYVKEVSPLEDAGDEPLMPVEDRIALFYGALSLAWPSIGRNPEEGARNRALFEAKLARMMGKIQDTMDKPRVEPESRYIAAKRGGRVSSANNYFNGGQATNTAPTYLENVTINGARITGDVTVNPSITIDGRDLSVDGAALDSHIASDAGVHGVVGDLVGTTDTQTLTNKSIDALNNIITNIDNAAISTTAAIERSKLEAGDVDKVAITDANGFLTESPVAASALTYLEGSEGLATVTLTDNTAGGVVLTYDFTVADVIFIDYSIKRGTDYEAGRITLITDGVTPATSISGAAIGSVGVTFAGNVNGTDLELQYTTTSTGDDAVMKYKVQKWLN